jgi:hypothetical protein
MAVVSSTPLNLAPFVKTVEFIINVLVPTLLNKMAALNAIGKLSSTLPKPFSTPVKYPRNTGFMPFNVQTFA